MAHVGKYRIVDRIGRGGMGSVYRAHDPVLDRPVALKVISTAADVTDEVRTRFFLEAQACARLSHPNIVTLYDLGEADGHLFIVMELLEGEDLRDLIARRPAMPLPDKLALMAQVCDGLRYAHQHGIVHRDVKPANIFVQRNGRVKLLDFGVARMEAAGTPVTRTGHLVGTLQYMAPERVRGRGDQRSDIFSLGAVLYEVLTYRPAFEGEDPMEILERLRSHVPPPPSALVPSLPPELDALVARALDKEPTRRFGRLDDLGVALQAVHSHVRPPESGLPDAVPSPAPAAAAAPASAASSEHGARHTPAGGPDPVRERPPAASGPRARWRRLATATLAGVLTGAFSREALVHHVKAVVEPASAAARRAALSVGPHLPGRPRRVAALGALALAAAVATAAWWPEPPRPDTQVEDLRRQVTEARTSALETDAATLAATTFHDAERAQAEGEQRLEAGDRAGAITVLRRSETAYRTAEREASTRRPRKLDADASRDAMLAAKARARPAEAEFAAALEHERRASALYVGLDFENAALTFRAATDLYVKTSVATPAVPPPDPGAPVRAALADYARAIETKDLVLLRRVRPALDDNELRRWARSFEITQSRTVKLRIQHVDVRADRAQVTGRREEVIRLTSGQQLRTETRFVCTLVRGAQGWTIEDLHESRDAGSAREAR